LFALPGGSAADPALVGAQAVQDFEQEVVDQYALAMSAAGLTDRHIGGTRAIVIEFARSLSKPLWEATCADADVFLAQQRRRGPSVSTRAGKAGALAGFYEFVIARYAGTICRTTGVLVSSRSMSSIVSPEHRWARSGSRHRMRRSTRFSPPAAGRSRRHASTCPRPATTSPPTCGAD
jgi:hypothetical protein